MTGPMTAGILLQRVAGVIARVAGPSRTPPGTGPETRLAGGGFWLDSVALLEAVVLCETEFGVSFDPDMDLTPESLASVGSLAALVEAKLGVAGRGSEPAAEIDRQPLP